MPQNNILLIWDRMGDYHRARWRGVEKKNPDREVFAADFGASDNLYGWNNTKDNPNYFLLSKKKPNQFDWRRVSSFIKILSEKEIGVICVAGYARPEYQIFSWYAKLSGRKVIFFAESWYPSGKVKDSIKSLYLKLICHGFFVSGIRARQHFVNKLGIKPSKIRTGYSVVDNFHFALPTDFPLEQKRNSLLCVARFSTEKNLILLVDAFGKSQMTQKGWELILVGGGPLKNELERKAEGHNIRLIDWQNYEDLPLVYHQAAVFILPSIFEPWGLVVNEAMAASLPVILSNEVGCLPDLLQDKINGWFFSSTSESDLVKKLNEVSVMNLSQLIQMGEESRKKTDFYSIKTFADNLSQLIEST